MPKIVPASYMPLFERIAGMDGRAFDGVLIDEAGLRLSIERELARLFNTTSHLTISQYIEAELSVLDYGLPDFRGLSFDATDLQTDLAIVIEKAVRTFEPRMDQPIVKVSSGIEKRSGVIVDIMASVSVGTQQRRVQFGLAISSDAALMLTAS
jgi:type VI secretion system protein ImpF